MKGLGFYTRLLAIFWLFGLVLHNFGESWLSKDRPLFQEEAQVDPQLVKPLSQIAAEAKPRGSARAQPRARRRRASMHNDGGWGAETSGDQSRRGSRTESDWGAAN